MARTEQTAGTPLDLESIRRAVAALIDVDPADVRDDDDLIMLGVDSIGVMKLASTWRARGADIRFGDLLERRTIAEWWALLAERTGAAAQAPAAEELRDDGTPFDLALMQHAYWIGRSEGQTLASPSHVYLEFDGEGVVPGRLERAVRAVLARHDMLRAHFTDDGRQRIAPQSGWPGLAVHDLRSLDGDAAARELLALRERESNRRLDVEHGLGLDVQLSLLPQGRTRLHVNIDMLVGDALSFRTILAEMARLYDEPGAQLPPLRISYRRYLEERRRRRAAAHAAAREAWRPRLESLPAPPELPLAIDPAAIGTPRATRREKRLDAPARDALARRAREHGLTLPVVLMTAFAETIGAWSARPRFLLNLPLLDREPLHEDVPRLVGDFTSSMLLDVDLSHESSFAARAAALQAQLHAQAASADYAGIEVLRDLSRLRGEPSAAPVAFTSALSMGELFTEDVARCFGPLGWMISQTSQVWLDHQVTEVAGGLLLNFDAVEQLFAPDVLDGMFGAYVRIVEWLVDGEWHAAVPDLLPAAQRAARAIANATDAPRSGRLLHERFFEHAVSTPEATALVWGGGEAMSYGELAARALRVAGMLAARGIAAGEPVAVALSRGPLQVEAVLGVLAAGAAYLPVGIEQPARRRARICASAGVRVSLESTSAPLPWPEHVETIAIEAPWPSASLDAPVPMTGDALAYVLYTSGSTGEPKGVEITHGAAMNTIDDLNDRFAVGALDRILAVSALDFDLSVYDIFGLLSAGGAVVLAEEDARRDGERLLALLQGHGVTMWQSVPALLELCLQAAGGQTASHALRVALVGGDWVPADLRDRVRRVFPNCRLIALGGTTETAIHSTVYEVGDVRPEWRAIPYGRPLRNVRCRVVDARGRDCPDRVAGELWIGGASVARGYRGDAERTARQFVEHDGLRWYRTGDLARYLDDGVLEFLGRSDFQIKLRGHRIAPGEIETALESHPHVDRAVVVVAAQNLAAAVVTNAPCDAETLRAWLAARVPAYMIPVRFTFAGSMPLSANGKIDRARIRGLVEASSGSEGAFEEPRTPAELAVAEAWRELLGVARVGRQDSFFALGGDSLLATRLLARLRSAGISGARLRTIFDAPKLAAFAAALQLGAAAPAAPLLPADPEHRHEPFPATEVQRAYWLGRTDAVPLGNVGSNWYWEFEGDAVDLARLEEAWNRLIRRHEMLRAVFDADGRQRILPAVPRFTIPAGSGALPAEMASQTFDVARWPLFDVRASHDGGRVRLGFCFDYIVLDALSIAIVFAELAQLYADPATELPAIDLSFRDYVLHARPDPIELAEAQEYWSREVATVPPPPQLPLRTTPASIVKPRFTRRASRLAAPQWSALVERARGHDLTPSTVLAAAFAEVLAAWSGHDELTMNLTLFDRRDVHPHIHRVLGDFTSLILVPCRRPAENGWLARAQAVRQQVWTSMQHRAVSAIAVMRVLAQQSASAQASVPVVFTSTLGLSEELLNLTMPFGAYRGGLSQTPQVWLDNQVMEQRGELLYNWDAVEELFPEGALDAMFGAWSAMLQWLASPDADWTQPAPPLLPSEQQRVREHVNDTRAPESGRCLHQAFFENAVRSPDRVALAWDGGQTTYGSLAARALRVAAALRGDGIDAGDAVAVTMPSGSDHVAAMLGILAAGAVYVPLTPDQPAERRARVCREGDVRRVIGNVDALVAGIAPFDSPVPVDPHALAYVIYTSGSTGEPKGVQITHRAAVNTIEDVNARFGVGEHDRVLALSSNGFDLSIYDVFGLLAAGGTIVLVDDRERREAAAWSRLVRQHRVTVWNSVPALLDMLLTVATPADLATLRVALLSGDWIGLDLPARLARHAPHCRFIGLGGATEASIWSNAFEVRHVAPEWRSIPYGWPLRNQKFRVADADGRDCPDFVAGELWIGGAGVSTGYRNDAAATARAFVEHAGERWYRTGDQGRYWPDGTLEFLGRNDQQVKIHGHRIELGEIEAALAAHPSVTRAVAIVAAKRLTAFVTADGADASELRRFVATRLPSYMVPAHIGLLASLPLTANGKVDRRALADAALVETAAADAEPPRDPLERTIASLWTSILGVRDIGRNQSFFTLGGDSLLGTRLVAALAGALRTELSLRQLFEAPTVADLASLVAAGRHAHETVELEEGVL